MGSDWLRGKRPFPGARFPLLGAYRTGRTTRVALQQSPIRSGGKPNGPLRTRAGQKNRPAHEEIHFCSEN